jgi:hypothetical protein
MLQEGLYFSNVTEMPYDNPVDAYFECSRNI